MTEPLVERLGREVAATGDLVSGVEPDQWGAPTPCGEWSVRQVVAHLVLGHRHFAAALAGEPQAGPPVLSELSDAEWSTAYRESGEAMVAGFAGEGALERPVTVPTGTVPGGVALHLRLVEALVHGWDLSCATGLPRVYEDALVEQELAVSRGLLENLPSDRRPFAPSQPVADDAPAIDRLVGLLGRPT